MKLKDVSTKDAPYVVLVGNCGAGKSTLVEKLTGITGRSASGSSSYTKTSEYFWVPDKSLQIADTPGSNPMTEKFEHNIQIGHALNYRDVSKLFIVVKADVRKDEVISKITQYADRFLVLPMDLVGVIVTYMDVEKEWSEAEFIRDCEQCLGIEDVVFSSIDKSGEDLLEDVLVVCRESHTLNLDCEMFLRMFKFNNSNRKILKVTDDIKRKFEHYKKQFEEQKAQFSEKEQVDLFFEYKAFLTESVEESKKEMSETLGFNFLGEEGVMQAGHLANMVNQIRGIIYDVRIASLEFQSDHGADDLRKCPHCGMIWAKVEGCEGITTCGNVPSTSYDVRKGYTVMATFTFQLSRGRLTIFRTGERSIAQKKKTKNGEYSLGCNKNITWSEMKKVPVPKEFKLNKGDVNVDDIKCLPENSNYIKRFIDNQLGFNRLPKRRPTPNIIVRVRRSSK